MRISSDEPADRPISEPDNIGARDTDTIAHPEPTTAEIAAKNEANTKQTEKTQIRDPASSKGSIVNDMA